MNAEELVALFDHPSDAAAQATESRAEDHPHSRLVASECGPDGVGGSGDRVVEAFHFYAL